MTLLNRYVVVRRQGDGELIWLGTVEQLPGGWRFIPAIGSHRRSRKLHASMGNALRPVGGLDRTETMTHAKWAEYLARDTTVAVEIPVEGDDE